MFSSVFTLFFLLLMEITSSESRSDSILDIINTKEVEKIIAERHRASKSSEKRFLLENELDDTYAPNEYDIEYEHERVKLLDNDAILSKPHDIYASTNKSPRIEVDLLYRRQNLSEPYKTIDLISDLHGYHGSKILKSSKNALMVTKLEYLQRDWCKTEPLIQKIKEQGCLTRTIINKFCYGQCNSFYIPKNPKKFKKRRRFYHESEDEDVNGPAFKSCAFCKPKKYTWITVTLTCPNSTPQFRKKRIQRIKQCRCLATDLN
ncbi:gremlin-2-like [Atheta coriaria]|uniref:gremlin-2-like n=1 Tax=Dalotia coriaria TaxID=877792 RepID=UPI0031F44652